MHTPLSAKAQQGLRVKADLPAHLVKLTSNVVAGSKAAKSEFIVFARPLSACEPWAGEMQRLRVKAGLPARQAQAHQSLCCRCRRQSQVRELRACCGWLLE